jgi:hypothetical protein
MEFIEGIHFKERLGERFSHKGGRVDINQLELVSSFTPNRYNHPKVQQWLKEGRAPKYLVSKKHNITIPVSLEGRMITALWYNGRPKG